MPRHPAFRLAILAAAVAASFASLAEDAPGAPEAPVVLEKVTVQASAFKRNPDDLVQPVQVIQGKELDRKRKATLGELLEGEPGVASSDFGPGVGRPIIRGQAGPRVLILENGLSTMDAATVSTDHAVALDPAHAEQVEIIKGPATLIYGSAASAGVVNVVDSRLPDAVTAGLASNGELSYGDNGSDVNTRLEAGYGLGNNQFHADFASRHATLFSIPGTAAKDGSGVQGHIPNSAVKSQSAAVSASHITPAGQLGVAASYFSTEYGLPAEPSAFILLHQSRIDTKGVLNAPFAGFSRLTARIGATDYKHTEFEAPAKPGTVFINREQELRLEAEHLPLPGGIRGVVGLQLGHREFAAVGSESFVPQTRTQQAGLFVVEEKAFSWGSVEGGVRVENSEQKPASSSLASRSAQPISLSLGGLYKLGADYHLRLQAARSQRAPSAEELYAYGPHGATQTFERGSPQLSNETVNNFEIGLDKHHGRLGISGSMYFEKIKDYIYLANADCNQAANSSAPCTPDGLADTVAADGSFNPPGSPASESLQLVDYRRAKAKFYGFEAETSYKILTGPYKLQSKVFADLVRGALQNGGDLPRITPARLGVGLDASHGPLASNLTYTRVQTQHHVAALETPTEGFNLLSADLSYRIDGSSLDSTVFIRGRNLLDDEARRHTSFLKDAYPLPGRSVFVGLSLRFN